jgi:hypothetical protein
MSLLALAQNFRFGIYNGLGISISNAPNGLPTVTGTRMRFDGTGSAVFDTSTSFFGPGTAASLGSTSYLIGPAWSNISGWLGGEFLMSAFGSGGASGTLALYLELSPDGGTTWPTPVSANGPGGALLITMATFASTTTASTASTIQRVQFEL